MSWFRRVRALFGRSKLSEDLEDEVQFHLAMREQWNVEQGMEPGKARRDARVRFGNAAVWRERMREIDLMTFPETVLQDLRYGARMLYRTPGFTVAAVIALALGIGVNTAGFTAYKAMIARSIDARDPSRMVDIALVRRSSFVDYFFTYPDYEVYRDHLHSFSGLIAVGEEEMLTLSGTGGIGGQRSATTGSLMGRLGMAPPSAVAGDAELASTFAVSENYFSVLGVTALRGRTFETGDVSKLAASPSVMISENYWQRRFGGDPALLGKSIRLNGVAFTIIGITPHDFVGTSVAAPDFWLPLSLAPLVYPDAPALSDHEKQCCRLYGRLAPGADIRQAQAEMTLLADHLRTLHDARTELSKPATVHIWRGTPFPEVLPRGLKFAILLIMVAIGMVLVIACANVASLQLARSAARQNELRLRLSLGASRWRLIRQLLTESALLALLSGGVALLFTWGLLKISADIAEGALPAEYGAFVVHVTPDLGIFAYVFAISLVAGILFGLAPALESSRSALSSALKANAGSSPGRSRRLRNVLIATQVAVSLVLMIAGSLLIRSSIHALTMDTGYDSKHVVYLKLQFPTGSQYTTERKVALFRALRTRLGAMPGVAAITSARAPDGDGLRSAAISVNGEKPSAQNTRATLFYTYVQGNYFQTLGIPLLFGRSFQEQAGQPENSVVVSESAGRQLWPGENPIGHHLRLSTEGGFRVQGEASPDGPSYQVIGVARDTRGILLDGSDSEQIYVPMHEDRMQEHPMLIRTQTDPAQFMDTIGPLLSSIDPDVLASSSTLDWMLRQTQLFFCCSFAAAIASTIGFIGLVLAAMGIYGTVSYIVVLRTREVGIRMALGAKRRDVLGLMLRESTRPVLVGLLVGMVLAVWASYLLRKVLYGINPIDGISFVGVSLLFVAIALFAAYVPSRRATLVDPVVALRYE